MTRATFVLAIAALALPAGLRAQTLPGPLIAAARAQLDSLNRDSAVALLRRALATGSGATHCERVRGLVLLGVTELMTGSDLGAQLSFREALRLDPELRVDSLAQLHSQLIPVFAAERASAPSTARSELSSLEFRGLPEGAQVTVNGERWRIARRGVQPGVQRYEIRARGYWDRRDQVAVAACASLVVDIRLTPTRP